MFSYAKGDVFPMWATSFVPYLCWLFFLARRTQNRVNWRAATLTVVIFELVVGTAETISVSRGHWVYNNNKLWGIKIWNVPIEEHLLYYLFAPLIVITFMHAVRLKLEEQEK